LDGAVFVVVRVAFFILGRLIPFTLAPETLTARPGRNAVRGAGDEPARTGAPATPFGIVGGVTIFAFWINSGFSGGECFTATTPAFVVSSKRWVHSVGGRKIWHDVFPFRFGGIIPAMRRACLNTRRI